MQFFFILAAKPLNDGTRGFRFNVLGQKGLIRLRKRKSNGINVKSDRCMTRVNLGRLSVYFEHGATARKLRHFAG
jgi:hypothetical protein